MSRNNFYMPVIGIEVHVELATKSKMFCGCSAKHFRVEPNIHTCPVCLGLPGALPVPNARAIDWCLMLGIALSCRVNKYSKFDRKNYFYPDLPKGYQISQFDLPFCENGQIKLKLKTGLQGSETKKIIRIRRVHLEEDTGKLLHKKIEGKKVTLVDFNRSGVPLVEVVSEPDIRSADEAVVYLKELQRLVRYLRISDADMEKGSMRCEINISLKKVSASGLDVDAVALPGYKVELKNINSFRFVRRAIEYEIERQREQLEAGEMPKQETRGWDQKARRTYSQRYKEEATDYRYFPEPDIPPITITDGQIKKLRNSLGELPWEKQERYVRQLGLSDEQARILLEDFERGVFFEQVVDKYIQVTGEQKQKAAVLVANLIIHKRPGFDNRSPNTIVDMIIKRRQARVFDEKRIMAWVRQALAENKKAVDDYRRGVEGAIGPLIGAVIRLSANKAEPGIVRQVLEAALADGSLDS